MKKLMILFALIMGVVSMKAQSNDLYQGITKKLPYRQMVTPYGVQVTFAKTVHIIFPSAVKSALCAKEMLVPSPAPIFAIASFAASCSSDEGTESPFCPSLS